MRPTEVDDLIDNLIKLTPIGYKFGPRPVTAISQKIRQFIYRGTLGMNVSSALRNLSQAANTYAELGERWTATGYMKLVRNWGLDELERVGVLKDSFIQDRNIGVYKTLLAKLDEGLFYLFEKAEKINRGAAYYGAKAKALSQGMSEQQAIEYAKGVVRKTQFVFGSIDTPLLLSSDINKTLLQFQSFNIKQGEFLLTKVAQRDIAGLMRYVGATLVMAKALKDAFGMTLSLLPINFNLTPSLQAGQATGQILFGEGQTREEGKRNLIKVAPAFIPAGVQMRKTIEGLQSYNQGKSTTPTGRTRFEIEQTPQNLLRSALFGQYSTPQAQQYFAARDQNMATGTPNATTKRLSVSKGSTGGTGRMRVGRRVATPKVAIPKLAQARRLKLRIPTLKAPKPLTVRRLKVRELASVPKVRRLKIRSVASLQKKFLNTGRKNALQTALASQFRLGS